MSRASVHSDAKQFETAFKVPDIETVDMDRYKRTVGIVRLRDGTLVNQEIITAGFAWVYATYCKKPICLEWKKSAAQSALSA